MRRIQALQDGCHQTSSEKDACTGTCQHPASPRGEVKIVMPDNTGSSQSIEAGKGHGDCDGSNEYADNEGREGDPTRVSGEDGRSKKKSEESLLLLVAGLVRVRGVQGGCGAAMHAIIAGASGGSVSPHQVGFEVQVGQDIADGVGDMPLPTARRSVGGGGAASGPPLSDNPVPPRSLGCCARRRPPAPPGLAPPCVARWYAPGPGPPTRPDPRR